ncbi:MAG: hypothetical protein AAES65_02640 [Candidatus Thiodiazotropha sp. (ex. Lucinoma kazani)]
MTSHTQPGEWYAQLQNANSSIYYIHRMLAFDGVLFTYTISNGLGGTEYTTVTVKVQTQLVLMRLAVDDNVGT